MTLVFVTVANFRLNHYNLKNKVCIVGAGPGDPELMTVKAVRCLQSADVVMYDFLFGPEILDLIPVHAEKMYVGKTYKDHQDQTLRQNTIHASMKLFYDQGKRVVRLKTGDPLIFGRGIEEIRFLIENNIPYELVPGITAGLAAANIFSIPLTERVKSSAMLFCTGHTVKDDDAQFNDISAFLIAGNPAIIYMGLSNLEQIIDRLIGQGVPSETKIAILSKVSRPEQEMVCGTFSTIAEKIKEHQIATPTVIIMGRYADSLDDIRC